MAPAGFSFRVLLPPSFPSNAAPTRSTDFGNPFFRGWIGDYGWLHSSAISTILDRCRIRRIRNVESVWRVDKKLFSKIFLFIFRVIYTRFDMYLDMVFKLCFLSWNRFLFVTQSLVLNYVLFRSCRILPKAFYNASWFPGIVSSKNLIIQR